MLVQGRGVRSRAYYWRGGSRRALTSRAVVNWRRRCGGGGGVGDGSTDRGGREGGMETEVGYRGWGKVAH